MLDFRELASLTVDAVKEAKDESKNTRVSVHSKADAEEKTSKAREHFDEMIDNTSFHGINYIVDAAFPIRRAVWFVITLSAFVYSILKVYESFEEFFEFPFETAIMRRYVDTLVFPAVSFCNLNDLRLSKMKDTLLDRAILGLNVTHVDFSVIADAPHNIEDMLVECIFDGEECSHDNFTQFSWRGEDRCFTFNSGKAGHALKSVTGPGVQRSLMLTLNIQHYEYYRDVESSGIHLMLHDQDQTPIRIQGPILPPGFATYIKVDKKLYVNLEPPYKTQCGSRKLKYHLKYSSDACWFEQLTEYVIEQCSCKAAFMPGDVPVCTFEQLGGCIWPQWEFFETTKMAVCPLPCEIDVFQYHSTRTLFPSESYARELKERMIHLTHVSDALSNKSDVTTFMRNNLLRLIIFYDDLSYELQEQQPSYDLAFFLGDIGGQIGLFVGAGAMSYFEIIDCIGMMVHAKFLEYVNKEK